MINLIKSRHARVRQQQRHITNDALELLFSYGVTKRQRGGCAVVNKFKASKRVPAHMLNSVNAVIEMAELQSFQSKRISRILITPQTATNSQLWMIIGLVLMFVAFVYRRKQKA